MLRTHARQLSLRLCTPLHVLARRAAFGDLTLHTDSCPTALISLFFSGEEWENGSSPKFEENIFPTGISRLVFIRYDSWYIWSELTYFPSCASPGKKKVSAWQTHWWCHLCHSFDDDVWSVDCRLIWSDWIVRSRGEWFGHSNSLRGACADFPIERGSSINEGFPSRFPACETFSKIARSRMYNTCRMDRLNLWLLVTLIFLFFFLPNEFFFYFRPVRFVHDYNIIYRNW